MKINGLGYRELEKLGAILSELGDKGNYKGVEFELDELTIDYNPSYDCFILSDGITEYKVDLGEI